MIEIVERFKNDVSAPPAAKLYFGHAETVVPLISLLGLFEGPPLTAEGFLLSKHRYFSILPDFCLLGEIYHLPAEK